MQIDTGAIVSLLPRSAADWLGVVFGIGRPIYLGSVGGGTFQARIHYMTMRVGSRPAVTAPFAIAEVDRVPQLLGRVGVLDRFRLILDPRHRRTEFVGPVHRENVD